MDVNQKLLEAFRAEHIEHLEGIRASLLRLEDDAALTAELDDSLRRAHSLKGAARITGLAPPLPSGAPHRWRRRRREAGRRAASRVPSP